MEAKTEEETVHESKEVKLADVLVQKEKISEGSVTKEIWLDYFEGQICNIVIKKKENLDFRIILKASFFLVQIY